TVDHARYINEILSVALEYGNTAFGSDWTFQQHRAQPHIHHLTQEWCRGHFPAFPNQYQSPRNSPDLNPLDYCIWTELAQAIKWEKVVSKKSSIEELKRATKQIRLEVVFESCDSWSWTHRLQRISKNNGN
ncbi:unnamed protein product, partial [Rotaria socialis]